MKRVKKILLLAVAVMVSVSVSAQTMEDFNNKYNEAGKLMEERKFADAIKGFEEVISMGEKIGPEAIELVQKSQGYLVTSYYQLGGTQAQARDYNNAIESLSKSASLAELNNDLPGKARATNMISRVYFALGADAYNNKRYAEAAETFAKGYAASPNNSSLALNLADSYDKIDSLQQAISIYQGVMKLTQPAEAQNVAKAKEGLTNMLLARAVKAGAANNLDEVVALTATILEYDPQNANATLLRLQTANNMKRYADAAKYGQAAAEAQTDPTMKSNAYFLLGVANDNLGNSAAAIAAFRNVTTGPNLAEARRLVTELSK